MTPLSQKILDAHQVRKTIAQKEGFIQLIRTHFPEAVIQESRFPRCRNIIIGDIEKAQVILTAHYDTCAQLPFPNFIAPKRPLLSLLYGVAVAIPIIAIVAIVNIFLGLLISDFWLHYWISLIVYFGTFSLLIFGPANQHTANDNTSGVVALCELLGVLTPDSRAKAAFVFFDHEETGLIGSSRFRAAYKQQIQNKLLINLDCVSDGDTIMLSVSKHARKEWQKSLEYSFQFCDGKTVIFTKAERTYYPSDQLGFPQSVAIAALKYRHPIGYYMDRIHTSKDTVFDKQNIKLLCDSLHTFLASLTKR